MRLIGAINLKKIDQHNKQPLLGSFLAINTPI